MRYRVVWSRDAFNRLLRAWNAAGKPEPAIHAFDQIESALTQDGESQGESRDGNRRVLIVPPLGVIFEVQQDVRQIAILDAWMIARPNP